MICKGTKKTEVIILRCTPELKTLLEVSAHLEGKALSMSVRNIVVEMCHRIIELHNQTPKDQDCVLIPYREDPDQKSVH